MNIAITNNVRETSFTAGESSEFCHYCKLSVTATQRINHQYYQLDIPSASEDKVMDDLFFPKKI
jgi:hypothetical protein